MFVVRKYYTWCQCHNISRGCVGLQTSRHGCRIQMRHPMPCADFAYTGMPAHHNWHVLQMFREMQPIATEKEELKYSDCSARPILSPFDLRYANTGGVASYSGPKPSADQHASSATAFDHSTMSAAWYPEHGKCVFLDDLPYLINGGTCGVSVRCRKEFEQQRVYFWAIVSKVAVFVDLFQYWPSMWKK